ncbi:MAG: hypothetical protein INQ03_25285 [Candidatus Heimdallarchaeota archaeon]|nr:hypothetical protein [Candidatus Heimdallarchaeota archaeon]
MRKLQLAIVMIMMGSMMFQPVSSQSFGYNFSYNLLIPSDDFRFEAMAQSIKQQWNSLLVDTITVGVTRPIYQNYLVSAAQQWDIAIVEFEILNNAYPGFFDLYHPESAMGSEVYKVSNTNLEGNNSDSISKFIGLIEDYDDAMEKSAQIPIAKELQQVFNEEVLLDIPISYNPHLIAYWKGFDGFDLDEGIVYSIFTGAGWVDIPDQRTSDLDTDEVLYPVYQTNKMPNPLYVQYESDRYIVQSMYSSLFMMDKQDKLHPGMAESYKHSTVGGKSIWEIDLYDNMQWSDGQPITAADIEFTLDLNKFSWIQADNQYYYRYLDDIAVHNDTALTLTFSTPTIDESYVLANTYILPEHIFNTTYSYIGEDFHPYEGGFPGDSEEWVAKLSDPVTGGAFVLDEYSLGEMIVVTSNDKYWFPNEDDTESFNRGGSDPDPYYFTDSDLNINKLSFQFSDVSTITKNSEEILFTSGKRDFIMFDYVSDENVVYTDDRFEFIVKTYGTTGFKLIFHPEFEEAVPYDIRLALAHGFNKDDVVNFLGVGYERADTIVSEEFSEYFNGLTDIPYDFQKAKDLFKIYGYDALEGTGGLTASIDAPAIGFFLLLGAVFRFSKQRR